MLSITRNKTKKHDKIFLLAKSKLNSIENLVCQALIDMEISHEEFITILNEKDNMKNERRHGTIRSSDELNKIEGKKNENNGTISKNSGNA